MMKLAIAIGVAVCSASTVFAGDDAALKQKIQTLLSETKTMTWTHSTYELLEGKEERTKGNVWWQGIDLQRIDVTEGRGEGRTVVLEGDQLDTGFITFDYDSRIVLSLRGNTVRQNGYMDDLAKIVAEWADVKKTWEGDTVILDYKTPKTNGTAKMWLNPSKMEVLKTETYENGSVVEKYEYSNIVYNPPIPPKTWKN